MAHLPDNGPAEAFASWVNNLMKPAIASAPSASWLKRARAVSGSNMYTYADRLESKAFDRLTYPTPATTAPPALQPDPPSHTSTVDAVRYAGVGS